MRMVPVSRIRQHFGQGDLEQLSFNTVNLAHLEYLHAVNQGFLPDKARALDLMPVWPVTGMASISDGFGTHINPTRIPVIHRIGQSLYYATVESSQNSDNTDF